MPKGVHPNHPHARQHGRWKAGPLLSSHGYVKLRVGVSHPLADRNGYAYEHLVIWCAAGKPRPSCDEVLTWNNGDRTDNRIENLFVISRAEHNRRKNAKTFRDARGRILSNTVARAIRGGCELTIVVSGKAVKSAVANA